MGTYMNHLRHGPFGQVYTSGECVGHLRRVLRTTVARYNYLSTFDRR
jgi:hypothetical protein